MSYTCEQLAEAFEGANLSVHGVYRTTLAADSAYTDHIERPTQLENRLLMSARAVKQGPASQMVSETLKLIHAHNAEPITLHRLAERHGLVLGPK
ncbi:hypothetical protein [Cohnella hashimotonis]|uniref:Uncharacterized protein n=1 Tax=Cohnella hashimotonis TaxID=2826895 RepID=A0ABT6TP39_9BACL|nr:hypothetical protein [Cohnella hashimotonis]MDI4648316.1 hypothetical protein [Cohnella hashimotonis]